MQIYAMRMFNFLRFGEKNNSIVFDLSEDQKQKVISGEMTMDQLYDDFTKDPVGNIKRIKAVGIEGLLGIVGVIDGNDASSNGAGKSTIMEAICYAHYGKIVRLSANSDSNGEAGSHIITRINGEIPDSVMESWVEEYFESNGRIYRVKRGRALTKGRKTSSPILEFEIITREDVLSESGHRTKDTKKSIDEVNDMSYDLFVSSQMFGQNDAGIFLSGTDKVRKEMMISLLDIETEVVMCLKSVREKRSKSDKKLSALKETVNVLDNQLNTIYKKYFPSVPSSHTELVNGYMLCANQLVEDHQIEIHKIDGDLKTLNESIGNLSNSDAIVKANAIKAEGLKIKQEKEAKIRQKDEQVSQWSKLLKEATDEHSKKANEHVSLVAKLGRAQQVVAECKYQVAQFDKKANDADLERSAKAKEVKPKYDAKKQELSDKLVELASAMSEIKTKMTIAQNARSKYSCQMAKIVDGGRIECLECGSLVEKQHFATKIEEESTKIKEMEASVAAFNAQKTIVTSQLVGVNDRLDKIAGFMAAEAYAIARVSENELKRQTLATFLEKEEEIGKLMSSVLEDSKVLEGKKVDYSAKISAIESSFKSDIDAFDVKLNDLRQKLADAQSGAEAITKQINVLNATKKATEDKKSKLNEKIGSVNKEMEQFKEITGQLKAKTEELNSEVVLSARLDKLENVFGLDGIQTRFVKRYLPLLNILIKEFLDILSEGSLNIKLFINDKSEVDLAISGGTASSYKMLSGGEKMIIRLASDIGLALLKFSRSDKKPEIICLDEIFGPLDAYRTSAVFKMLHALQDKFNRVLIITHNAEIKDKIPNNILVEKSGGLYGLSEIKYIS